MFLGFGVAETAGHRLGHALPARVRMGVLSRPGASRDGVESRHGVGVSQYVFKMPDLGEGTVDAEIVAWHAKPGDAVTEDQLIVEVMTDKAAVEVAAPGGGRGGSITGAPGDQGAGGCAADRVRWERGCGGGRGGGTAGQRGPHGAECGAPEQHGESSRGCCENCACRTGASCCVGTGCRTDARGGVCAARAPGAGYGITSESTPGAWSRHRFVHGSGGGARGT